MSHLEVFNRAWNEVDLMGKKYVFRKEVESVMDSIEKIINKKIIRSTDRLKLRRFSPQYAYDKVAKDEFVGLIDSLLGISVAQLINVNTRSETTNDYYDQDVLLGGELKSVDELKNYPRSPLPPRRSESFSGSEIQKKSPPRYESSLDEQKLRTREELETIIRNQTIALQNLIKKNIRMRQLLEDLSNEKDSNAVLYDSIKKKAKLQDLKIQSLSNQLKTFQDAKYINEVFERPKQKNTTTKEPDLRRVTSHYPFFTISNAFLIKIVAIVAIFLICIAIFNSFKDSSLFGIIRTALSKANTSSFNKDWRYEDIASSDADVERIIHFGGF